MPAFKPGHEFGNPKRHKSVEQKQRRQCKAKLGRGVGKSGRTLKPKKPKKPVGDRVRELPFRKQKPVSTYPLGPILAEALKGKMVV